MRPFLIAWALLASFSAWPGVALANGRFPTANQIVFHPSNTTDIAVRTTFGILLSHDGGETFSFVCETLLGYRGNEDPALGMMDDGSLLVSMFVGQRRATSQGCDWPFVDDRLDGFMAIDNVIDPTLPSRAYVITSAGGRANGLWRATESGQVWEPIGTRFNDILFETVEVAPSNPMRLYLTGAIPPTSSMLRRPFIFRSDDGGLTWTMFEQPLLRDDTQLDANIYLSAVDPLDEDRLYIRVRGEPDDRLMISDDGGESMREITRLPSMLGFARSADGAKVWIGSPLAGLHRSEDRGEHFTRIGDIAASCLTVRGSELWACGRDAADGFAVGRSIDDGVNFEEVMRLISIDRVPSCGAGSDVSVVCQPALESLRSMLGVLDDAGVPTDASQSDAALLDAAQIMDAARADAASDGDDSGGCSITPSPASHMPWLMFFTALSASAIRGRRSNRKAARR